MGYNRRVSRNRYESFPFDSLLTSTFCVVSCIIMLMCTLEYHSTLSQSIYSLFIYYLFRHSIVRDHLRSKSSEEISILADTLPFNCPITVLLCMHGCNMFLSVFDRWTDEFYSTTQLFWSPFCFYLENYVHVTPANGSCLP